MTSQFPYRVNDRALCRQIGDEAVILDLDSGVYYGLNATGARVWELLELNTPVSDIYDLMLGEFEVTPDSLNGDVQELLRDLVAKGLVLQTSGGVNVQSAA